MDYQHSSHTKFLIVYHLIFVVKYRKPLLVQCGQWMKDTFSQIAQKADFAIKEMQVEQDHIHIMVTTPPKLSPLQIARRLKQQSTYRIWQEFPELKKHFWKEKTFWSDGYFCCSIVCIETIRHYIQTQG
jgi:putative transposase